MGTIFTTNYFYWNSGQVKNTWISYDARGPVEDPKSYREFFEKIDKGLFIQKDKL